jgi:hypothetical protein
MSTIDRRAFALGFLILPLTSCLDRESTSFSRSRDAAATQTVFLNAGHWTSSGPPVFVVTGGINR